MKRSRITLATAGWIVQSQLSLAMIFSCFAVTIQHCSSWAFECISNIFVVSLFRENTNASMDVWTIMLYLIWTSQFSTAFYAHLPFLSQTKLYSYSNKTFSNSHIPTSTSNHTSEIECISTLRLSKNGLKVVVIERTGNRSVMCHFFDNEPKMVNSLYSKYIVQKENYCSRICDTLNYNELCGPCKCYNACNNTVPRQHICDCTHDVPARSSCKKHYESGFSKSGRYLIDPVDQGSFPVYCEMEMKFKSNMELNCETILSKSYIGSNYELLREDETTFASCYGVVMDAIKFDGRKFDSITYELKGKKRCFGVTGGVLISHGGVESCKLQLKPFPPVKAPEISSTIQMLVRYDLENMEFWDRPMEEYESGFGSMDMWIGLNNLHRITTAFKTDMHVLMVSRAFRDLVTTTYEDIHVKSKSEGYQLTYEKLNHYGARDEHWNFQFK